LGAERVQFALKLLVHCLLNERVTLCGVVIHVCQSFFKASDR
jgi:hypothetical protein